MAILFCHQADFRKPLDDVAEEVGRGGEVKKIGAVGVVILVDLGKRFFQLVIGSGIVEISTHVTYAADEPVPQFGIDGAGCELFEVFGDLLPRIVIAHGAAAHADHGELARQQLLAGEVVESGNQLAARQVAGKAEDHHDTRISGSPDSRFGGCWQNFCLSHRFLVIVRCGLRATSFELTQNLFARSPKLGARSRLITSLPALSVLRDHQTSVAWRRAVSPRMYDPAAVGSACTRPPSALRLEPLLRSPPGSSSGPRRNPARTRCTRRAWDSRSAPSPSGPATMNSPRCRAARPRQYPAD